MNRRMLAGMMLGTVISAVVIVRSSALKDRPQAPLPQFDVMERTIDALQDEMAHGRVTSRQLVDAYLARIESYDRRGPGLNALIALNPRAREIAEALDDERAARKLRGPLHGLPIVVKDNYDTVDMPTTGSTLGLATYTPPADAFLVKKLREAGAVILGKTNLHELAAGITTVSSLGGQTRNPYDPSRNPGGSSGGTGAAVAANFAVFGMGSDTCGSIRIPSANNSLVGLRGTAGLSSRSGIIPLSHTQDIGGPLARTVTDLALALDATAGPDPNDPSTAAGDGRRPASFRDALRADALKGARIGVLTAYFTGDGSDAEVSDVVRTALAEMKPLGAETTDVTIPDLDKLVAASGLINYEFKFDLMDYLARVPDAPVRSLGEILDRGLYHAALEQSFRRRNAVESRDSEAARKAMDARRALAEAVGRVLDDERLDAIAYPTLRRRLAITGEPQGGSTCQVSAQSGLPAISVPAGFTADGLPVGLELLGHAWDDARLVALAYAFEQATHHRRPPLYTPPLVRGRPPAPITFSIQPSAQAVVPAAPVSTSASAEANFVFDPVVGRLQYEAAAAGLPARDVLLAALHRGAPGENGPILYRLLDPGTLRSSGALTLTPRDRADLAAGRIYFQVYTRAQPLGALRGQITMP